MTFEDLLSGAAIEARSGDLRVAVSGLHYDSRRIAPGNVFVAMRGETSDGNRFIPDALARGAAAIVSDCATGSAGSQPHPGLPWVRVAHGRRALAVLSANFFGHPADRLRMIGITGTNGKTTTSFLLEGLLAAAGLGPVALIGTIEYHVAAKVMPAPHTTPEALELNLMFADAVAAKPPARAAVMEVSSHALAQERTYGIAFDTAVFTNLTRDHLDYHGTMEAYFEAKTALFTGLGAAPPRIGVINTDDPWGVKLARIATAAGSRLAGYGIRTGDLRTEQVALSAQGTSFLLKTPSGSVELRSRLVGEVSVYNILAAAAAAMAAGASLDAIVQAVAKFTSVPGRFERVDAGQPFTVVVDYAHTDDALRNLTSVARDLVSRSRPAGRVITVFGCGGDRDRSKRPLMGEAAGRGSDLCVLTSDNPRSEDPLAIMAEAESGLQKAGARYAAEPDRRLAIALAIREARPGDIVLIAGKGHEKIQLTRAGSAPFDDVEEAREALVAAGFGAAAQAGGRR